MNRLAMEAFSRAGGQRLTGRLLDQQASNTYCSEKNGARKLVHQAPWHRDGQFGDLVETVVVLPARVETKKRLWHAIQPRAVPCLTAFP